MKIVLIGFMGSGKTTVAATLADKLKLKVFDMDKTALKKSNRSSINEIFEKDGEKTFREIELEVAKEIGNKNNIVVSTGGGVVMDQKTMNYLLENTYVIYLKASFDRIKKRVALKKVRPPLFQNVISAKKLFDLREPLYENYANLIIDTDEKSVDQVIKEILKGLNGRK